MDKQGFDQSVNHLKANFDIAHSDVLRAVKKMREVVDTLIGMVSAMNDSGDILESQATEYVKKINRIDIDITDGEYTTAAYSISTLLEDINEDVFGNGED